MKTRRKFIRTGAATLGVSAVTGMSRAHDRSAIPLRPKVPAEKLTDWRRIAAPTVSEGAVTMSGAIYSREASAREIQAHTNVDRPPVTFFSATLRYAGDDRGYSLDGASISLPLPLGFGVNLPISLVRSVLGFAAVPIPESVERRARNEFTSVLERERRFDTLDTAFGDFPGSETYHKSGYQTITEAYEGVWANRDGDGVGQDIGFDGVLSIETTGDGTDFLAVGGMYPAEEWVVTASIDWPEFEPEAIQSELKSLMRATRLAAEADGGA